MPAYAVPTAIKKMKGTFRKDRATFNEPEVAAVPVPEAPEQLREDERACWESLRSPIDTLQVFSEADHTALRMLAQELARYRRLVAEAEPDHERITACSKSVLSLMSHFGLTPASRSKISKLSSNRRDETPLDEFLS